jgi:PAS domain S-box-containing protein
MSRKELIKYLKTITVLYVEDDDNTREQLEFFLSSKVSHLYVAKNGEEGFELFKQYNPDLVISDIQMPILDGISMSELIKNHNPDARILLITAFNDTDYLFKAIKLSISNYLTKPLDLSLLVDTMINQAKNINLEKENKEIYNSLKQYKDIVDERSIISKTDLNGLITYINEPFEKISGYKKEEIIGKSHHFINHPDNDKLIFQDMWNTIKNEKKSWHGRLKNLSKDKKEYFIDILIKPILDLDENIIEFISLSNDITDLEKTKEYFKNQTLQSADNLTESIRIANAYKEAIDESNIIIKVNLNRIITYANEAFYNISGYESADLIGKPYEVLKHQNITSDEFEIKLNQMFSKSIWKGKVSNLAKNSNLFHCNVTVYPLKDKDGNVIEYLGIRHDITEMENLHAEIEDTQREIIYKLGEIGESRSQETGNHVKRVAEYSKLLAKKVNLSEEDINTLFIVSPMHDIGKVGIPDYVLNKPGKLDENEWEIMKTHAKIGYDILNSSNSPILKSAAIVSYMHHEKWDGLGYPQGLKGEDIHIFGRITAIADVFDALGSDRCYKKAWPLEKILEFFEEQKAKHFDPKLIDLFVENLDEFLEISNKYKDNYGEN